MSAGQQRLDTGDTTDPHLHDGSLHDQLAGGHHGIRADRKPFLSTKTVDVWP
jgi:hypothetical protein